MTGSRNSIYIIGDVLDALATGDKRKTMIMYLTLLNTIQTTEYLKEMQNFGLISMHQASREYFLTEKGSKAIKLIKDLKSILALPKS